MNSNEEVVTTPTTKTMSESEEVMEFYLRLDKAKLWEFIDLTLPIGEVVGILSTKIQEMHWKYVFNWSSVNVFDSSQFISKWLDEIIFRLDQLYSAFKTKPYQPRISELDIGKWYKVNKTFTTADQPSWIKWKMVMINWIDGNRHWWEWEIGQKLYVKIDWKWSDKSICENILWDQIPDEDVIRMQAEEFVEQQIKQDSEAARNEKRDMLKRMTELESIIAWNRDKDLLIRNYITMESTTKERILTNYPHILDYVTSPSDIIIKFKPWFELNRKRDDGEQIWIAKKAFAFKINKSDWSVRMVEWAHPHVSNWSLCQWWFGNDFATAAGQRNIDYMIELLWQYLTHAWVRSEYSAPSSDWFKRK